MISTPISVISDVSDSPLCSPTRLRAPTASLKITDFTDKSKKRVQYRITDFTDSTYRTSPVAEKLCGAGATRVPSPVCYSCRRLERIGRRIRRGCTKTIQRKHSSATSPPQRLHGAQVINSHQSESPPFPLSNASNRS